MNKNEGEIEIIDAAKQKHKYCTKCGNSLEIIKRHSFCPGCGAEDGGRKFCPECGYSLHIHPKDEILVETEINPNMNNKLNGELQPNPQLPIIPETPQLQGRQQYPQNQPTPSPYCPRCGTIMSFVSQSQWYCPSCMVCHTLDFSPPPSQQPFQTYPPKEKDNSFGKFVDAVRSILPDWGELKNSMTRAAEEEEKTGRPGQAGKIAEEKVSEVFKAKKYRIIRRDWQTQYGEIDIIAARGNAAIMIECKFRKTPLGIAEFRSYMELFRWVKRQSIDGTRVNSLVIIAPIGGVSQQVRNEIMGVDNINVWEEDRFHQECQKLD